MASNPQWTVHTAYKLSATTFEKHSRTKAEYDEYDEGEIFYRTRFWKNERIINEARALILLAKTKIPTPQYIQCGQNPDGTMFLEMSRVEGIDLSKVGQSCHMPGTVDHSSSGDCNMCKVLAQANAKRFIEEELLPELAKLRSHTTGLDGFVMPPAWMLEIDERGHWKPITSAYEEFVFIHGDLGPSGLLMNPGTLEVKCVIDREHSGYFPPQFQKWAVVKENYYDLYKDREMICGLASIITAQLSFPGEAELNAASVGLNWVLFQPPV